MPRRTEERRTTWEDVYDVAGRVRRNTQCRVSFTVEHPTSFDKRYEPNWQVVCRLHAIYDGPSTYRRLTGRASFAWKRGKKTMPDAFLAAVMAVDDQVWSIVEGFPAALESDPTL